MTFLEIIGKGGFGKVYIVVDKISNEQYAIKKLYKSK